MLKNILVVGFEQAVAAPLATRLLASDGARVIKVERTEGDFARTYDTFAAGSSSYFSWLNHGKESCVVDVKTEHALVDALLSRADVVIQNLGPGSAEKLSIDASSLRRLRPEIIAVDITGFGKGSRRKAYDLLVTAEAGLCSVTGSDGGGPGRVGVSIADIATGRTAYAAVLRALYHRERTGEGSAISVSLFDVVAEMMTVPLLQYRATGKPPSRMGLRHPSIAPYGAYRTGDGVEIVISCQSEREWVAFCEKVLGMPSLAVQAKFDSGIKRVKNRAELDALVQNVFSSLSAVDALARLEQGDIAFGKLSSVEDLSVHEYLSQYPVTNEFGAMVNLPIEPVRVDITHGVPDQRRVPRLGEHSASIRSEFLRI